MLMQLKISILVGRLCFVQQRKNHASVTVVVDPADYAVVLDELAANGETSYETRQRLAAKVFRHTAAYDALIAEYFTAQVGESKPENSL